MMIRYNIPDADGYMSHTVEYADQAAVGCIGQLVAIAAAIARQTDTAYNVSWQRKAALETAQTVEEVETI